ncbi:MAG: hypothetical protein GEU68_03660 [Actinobacteria bacterium]|nr:hypothetical protein [Actinomycetota bacterium]
MTGAIFALADRAGRSLVHPSVTAAVKTAPGDRRFEALRFIIALGFLSLFADMVYEGARSILGPFLVTLGASAAAVGVISGVGEFVGYALRVVAGYAADKTHRYWALTIAGYLFTLVAAPLLGLVGRVDLALALVIAERLGKAIRTPARDALLSHASAHELAEVIVIANGVRAGRRCAYRPLRTAEVHPQPPAVTHASVIQCKEGQSGRSQSGAAPPAG